ncbi:DUF445 domain-containing protein [Saccharopolyspora sp. NPDC002376]
MPRDVQRAMISRVQADAPRLLSEVLNEIKSDVDNIFDLKDMVVTSLVWDKELLNRIFLQAGGKEFQFIRRSGAVQMSAWVVFKVPLIMPLFGLFTGWLALKTIFRSQQPKRFEWQGLFHKRRDEVAEAYCELIAAEIITPRNVIEAGISELLMAKLPETMGYVEDYAADAMDIRNTLVGKMKELDASEFEELLRPASREEERTLIATGAALGFVVSEAQVLVLEHVAP